MIDALVHRIRAREARVGVIGLGYVGLPLVREFAAAGFLVTGFDVDEAKVASLRAGASYIRHFPSELVAALVDGGDFEPTADFGRLGECDAVLICLPTPLTPQREPDTSYIERGARDILATLRPGQLVVLESTTYPGTMDEVVKPILESGGLRAGEDFLLAYSPEREDPGNPHFTTAVIPKVVGGHDPGSLRAAEALYEAVVSKVVPVSSMRAAEATKILENIYRAVNIALVNELKVVFTQMGIDVWEVIDAAATKPFGYQPFYPGPGLGGHCLLPGERLALRVGGEVRIRSVEEHWADLAADGARLAGETEVTAVTGVEVPALQDAIGTWNRVVALGRRHYRGAAVRLHLRGGRSLAVTRDHRMLVHDDGALVVRRAGEVAPGHLVPVWRGHEEWEPLLNPRVDLLGDPAWAVGRAVGVRLASGDWRPCKAVIRDAIGAARADEVVRSGRLALETFLALSAARRIDVPHDDVVLCTGRGRSARSFPAAVELTPDFARLVGYYLSEGCVVGSRTVFTFHADELDTIADVVKLLGSLGLDASSWRSPVHRAIQVKAGSLPLAVLLEDVLECGAGSYDARVPPLLLGASAAHRTQLLAGLLRGDGSVWTSDTVRDHVKNGISYRSRSRSAEVSYFSVSEALASDVEHLMLSLGYVPALQRRRTQPGLDLRVHGSQDLLVPVERIERLDYEGPVYSLETEPSHTFATTNGIVVANCIPVDPFYLTWKAREYEHATRFIELAGEINTSMPTYVISRLARALNDHGKPVRGSRVLVLGIAYKPDVDDDRESPSFRLIEELQELGAIVSYNDPCIPRLRPGRKYDLGLESVELTPDVLAEQDCVLVSTAHSAYDWLTIVRHSKLVVDTRNATSDVTEGRDRIVKA